MAGLDAVEHLGGIDDIEHGTRDCAGKRIAAVSGAMHARTEHARDLGRRQHRADRKSAADPLGRREDVRNDALLHVREQRAGAPHAALDLVEDQERVVLARQPACSLQERRRARRHPAFALHRLENHRADVVAAFVAERGLERRDVVVGDVRDARRARAEALCVLRLASGRDREQRAAVERVQRRDDAQLVRPEPVVRPAPRELQRRLVRFGAGIAEEHALGERAVDETLRESQRGLVREPVADVPELAGLLVERADHRRMAVSECGHGDAAREIDVELAVLVPDAATLRRAPG